MVMFVLWHALAGCRRCSKEHCHSQWRPTHVQWQPADGVWCTRCCTFAALACLLVCLLTYSLTAKLKPF